jgi:hypothetical protein
MRFGEVDRGRILAETGWETGGLADAMVLSNRRETGRISLTVIHE